MKRYASWPPYVAAVAAFVVVHVVGILIVGGYLMWSVWDPSVPWEATFDRVLTQSATSPRVLVFSVVVTSSLLALIAVTLAVFGARPRAQVFVRRMRLVRAEPMAFLAATVGVLGMSMVLESVVGLMGLGEEGSLGAIREALASVSSGRLVAAAVVIGAMPGIGEELFFRGYLMRRIEIGDGVKNALLTSSIVFGLFHADPIHSPTAALIGFYLGWMVLETGSLWPAIVAHAVNNFTAAIMVRRDLDESLAFVWIVLGAAAAMAGAWYVKQRKYVADPAYW